MRKIMRMIIISAIIFLISVILIGKYQYQNLITEAETLGLNTTSYANSFIFTKSHFKKLNDEVNTTKAKQVESANNPTHVPILMYHFFTLPGAVGPDRNWLDISVFESHLQMFKDNDITPITLEQYDKWFTGAATLPQKSILITIDDGQPGTVDLAAPLLEKYGFSAVSFEITSMWNNYDIKKNTSSLQLASHTNNMHYGFCDGIKTAGIMQCTDVQMGIDDLLASNVIIDEEATMFCYPFGGTEGNAYEIVKGAGFKYATTIEPGISTRSDDPLLLPRVRVNGDTSAEMLKDLIGF
jgi:peptidoglycan/xylan/chitin deacetylase (PgdA/CDA1 family)